MGQIRKVLFPSDYSEISLQAARQALEYCRLWGAELEILHVVELNSFVATYSRYATTLQEIEFDVRKAAEQNMEAFVNDLGDTGSVRLQTKIVSGVAADTIAEHADEVDVDVIIMATHGRAGLPRFILGSVTEEVLRTTLRPVLTLKVNLSEKA